MGATTKLKPRGSMSRPRYETEEDVQNEWQVAQQICLAWKKRYLKMIDDIRLDYEARELEGDQIVHYTEIKCRKTPLRRYPTYTISLSKVEAADHYSALSDCPVYLFVRFKDGLFYMPFHERFWVSEGKHRHSRNDPMDKEPMANYKVTDFEPFRG